MNSYDLETLLFAIALGLAVASLMFIGLTLIFFGFANATAQIDHSGDCFIKEHPYIMWCKNQKYDEFMEKFYNYSQGLKERFRE